jgi:hypothetical protein
MRYSKVLAWPNSSTRESDSKKCFEALVSHLPELMLPYASTVTLCRSAGKPWVHLLIDSSEPFDDSLQFYNGIEELQTDYDCRAQSMESLRLPSNVTPSTIHQVLRSLPGVTIISGPVLVSPSRQSLADAARKQAALDAHIAREAASILASMPSYGRVEFASEVTGTTKTHVIAKCHDCGRALSIARASVSPVREGDLPRHRLNSPFRCECGENTTVLFFREGGP